MLQGRIPIGSVQAAERCALAIAAPFAAIAILVAQEHPRAPHVHPDAQKLENPIESSPESIASGRKLYSKFCANCHGTAGRGNGRLAAGMAMYGTRPSDLTDDIWQHGSTDGEIFVVIRDGIGPDFHMDAYQGRMSDQDIWNMVNYIKTLAIGKQE